MNPLRKRFYGDTVAAQLYTKQAMDLLEAVHRQRGDCDSYQLHRTLGNGVQLFASTHFGKDEIRIVTKSFGGIPAKQGREYCVWEGDAEHFTPEIEGIYPIGPCTGSNSDVLFGAWISGAGIFPDSLPVEPTTSNVDVYRKSNISVKIGGGFSVDSNTMPGSLGVLPSPTYGAGGNPGSMIIIPSVDVASGRNVIYSAIDSAGNNFTYATALSESPGQDKFNLHFSDSFGSVSYYDGINFKATATGMYNKTVDNTWTPIYATSTTASDWVVVVPKTAYGEGSIVRYQLKSSSGDKQFSTIPLDILYTTGSASASPVQVVMLNDNSTAWCYISQATADGEVPRIFTSTISGWTEAKLSSNWPVLNSLMFFTKTKILHDPVTDAVAIISGDMSGAWIFNGKDCFNVVIPPFFYRFNTIPFSDDITGNQQSVSFTQFYDAVIYAVFGIYKEQYNIQLPRNKFVGASYKIGRLKQKKVTSVV